MGTTYASAASPSESEESFVSAELENTSTSKVQSDIDQSASKTASPRPPPSLSSVSRREGSKPSTSTASISPSRNARLNGRSHRDPAATPLASQQLPSPLSPPNGSYFTAQPGATPAREPRSPTQRRPRPPASRSSHGIETHSGPPPALSTQRPHNADSPWRSQPPADLATTPKPILQRAEADDKVDSVLQASRSSTHDRRNSEPAKLINGTRPLSSTGGKSAASMTYQDERRLLETDEDPTLRINGQKTALSGHSGQRREGQSEHASPEDLFLDLARGDSVVDDASEVMSRSERRRSRLGIQQRIPRPLSSSNRPSTSGAQFPSHHPLSSSQHGSASFETSATSDSFAALRVDMNRNRTYAASAHPMVEYPHTQERNVAEKPSFSSPMQLYSPESQRAIGRRRSIQATSPGLALQASKSSNRSYLSKRSRYASPPFADQSQRDEGTESTVSTTAASTVWDELDDMKARIRQLELTGKIPSSSNAAISSALGDRPPTAGTTMTTLSFSPKRRQQQSLSPENSTNRGRDIAEVHPLLHSALKRAREAMNADVYQILEATAVDAMTLAAIAGGVGAQASGVERGLRRKADSMCRYLTELCIALAEEKSNAQFPGLRSLPESRNGTPLAPKMETVQEQRFLRGVSEDPELRASSRVMSRLESRRSSLLGSGSNYSPREPAQEPATPTQPGTTLVSKLDRTNSVLKRKEKDEESKVRRAPSRATTEVGQMRPSPQTRVSREYISNHPLPGLPQRSPSVQSSLPTQKSYLTGSTNSPVTPNNALPVSRRYLQGSNPPSSSESARLVEARQRRLASLGQPNSASQPLAGRLRQNESRM